MQPLVRTLALLIIIFLSACGADGSKNNNTVAGIWSGKFKSSSGEEVLTKMTLAHNGQMQIGPSLFLFSSILGTFSVSGNDFRAGGSIHPFTMIGNTPATSFKAQGKIKDDTLSFDYTNDKGEYKGAFLFTKKESEQRNFNQSSSLKKLKGQWSGGINKITVTPYNINVKENGTFNISELEGCIINGQFGVIASDKNLYSAKATLTSCDTSNNNFNGEYKGLASLTEKNNLELFMSNGTFLFFGLLFKED